MGLQNLSLIARHCWVSLEKMDYSEYTQSIDLDGLEGWSSVEDLLEELEKDSEREREVLETQIEDVQEEVERVGDVYESNAEKLEETIRRQSKRLERAENSAGVDEREVRDRLARLYRELRQERREELDNRLELKIREWKLERELEEIKLF